VSDWKQRTQLLIGEDGLQKLEQSHVLVVGLGGVGSYAAEALVRAGVGKMTIVDGDVVDPTNKNRQLQALDSTIGQQKALLLKERFLDINPHIQIIAHCTFLEPDAFQELLSQRPLRLRIRLYRQHPTQAQLHRFGQGHEDSFYLVYGGRRQDGPAEDQDRRYFQNAGVQVRAAAQENVEIQGHPRPGDDRFFRRNSVAARPRAHRWQPLQALLLRHHFLHARHVRHDDGLVCDPAADRGVRGYRRVTGGYLIKSLLKLIP
jgi:hypothetical protein